MSKRPIDKLHIGCFDQPVDGWYNTDITPHLFIARIPFLAFLLKSLGKMGAERYSQHVRGVFRRVHYLDLAKRFPFPDNSFRYVFSSHVLEHIPRRRVPGLLREILRVLKPGGIMRVSVPDLTAFVQRYTPETADEFVRGVFEIEQGMEKNRHHWMYSSHSLRGVLEESGFVDVRQCAYREGRCADIQILDNRPGHSLFMEGCKK